MRRIILVNLALTALLVCVFDVVAFFVVPQRYVTAFKAYRVKQDPSAARTERWPRYYYVANESMGFDIGVNRTAVHRIPDLTYPIWSNSLGCFDKEHQSFDGYVYLAGDSFTWGHAAFEQKFGTLVEQRSGTPVLKCGVGHTGQRHQFAKFTSVVERTGSFPKAVFVFFFQNDIANDYAYPHTTVIDGWLVDAVWLNSQEKPVRLPEAELARRVKNEDEQARLQEARRKRDAARPVARFKAAIKQYSLASNIVTAAAKGAWTSEKPSPGPKGTNKSGLHHMHLLPYTRSDVLWYRDNPYARPNQQALLAFKESTAKNNVPLIVVIIPRRGSGLDSRWHGQLHEFLRLNGIRYLDLASSFSQRRVDPAQLYWESDSHFNVQGNEVVADILMEEFPEIWKSTARSAATAAPKIFTHGARQAEVK